jgi:hypothetical protein
VKRDTSPQANPLRTSASRSTTKAAMMQSGEIATKPRGWRAQGPWIDLALHTLGWKAFQDLCAQVSQEILNRPVEIYREAQDDGQDAVFLTKPRKRARAGYEATIQCKFTSAANRRLRPGDLKKEEDHITALATDGRASTYILMTNMSVDASVAAEIKHRLRALGVLHPHVFGREFLILAIRTSARLRALVPRVYGLGDLSLILDERQAIQTKALLGHMEPTLKVYVPTTPHRQAVRSLANHKIVLLLGDAATGKSTIAAILATTAAEEAGHQCYKSDGPEGLLEAWNPEQPGAFFWIDDAFGPNQPRQDFIDRWISIMPKVQAAIAGGNRFVLTSRRHIYEAAKPKLGSRNHPLFRDGQAIVNVGRLTLLERKQILYNHIKAGNQPAIWKLRVKPQLDSLSNEPSLIPEIARRLADAAYTRQISTAYDSLLRFICEPKEHLLQTIRELSKLHRAALTLVFLHRGNMPVGGAVAEMQQLVLRYFAVDAESLGQALQELRDSFLVQTSGAAKPVWAFKHPTIADAVSAMLGETEGMAELYLRGTKSESIVEEAICLGAPQIPDAVVIPEMLDGLLVERLAELPDEVGLNGSLFAFLDERSSDQCFRILVSQHPSILSRRAHQYWRLLYDPRVRAHARAFSLGLLSSAERGQTANELEHALFDTGDASFLGENGILALLQPTNLLTLTARIRDRLLVDIPAMADSIADQADLDMEPGDNFDDLSTTLRSLGELFNNDKHATNLIAKGAAAIRRAIETVSDRKTERDGDDNDVDDWDWGKHAPGQASSRSNKSPDAPATGVRSLFSDVDE